MNRPLAGFKILIVDDQACVRRLIARVLTGSGAQVVEAASVAAALAALGTFRPQLLISDINMPLEDGYSLLRRIRALEAGWALRLPAIALTGGGGVAGELEAHCAGFSVFLTKPFLPSALVAAARDLLPEAC